MPKKAPKPEPSPFKRQAGFLVCDTCERAVPYQGMAQPTAKDPWPMHKCLAYQVRSFDRFTLEDPTRLPIGGGAASPLETEDNRPEDMRPPVVDL